MLATKTRLYLSKVSLDPTRLSVQEALANPWRMHQIVAAVGGVGRDENGRTLYRLEFSQGDRPNLLVQSPREIDWTRLVEAGVATVETKSFAPESIATGALLAFRVLAAATWTTNDSRLVTEDRRKTELEAIFAADPSIDRGSVRRFWTQHDRSGARIGWKYELANGSRGVVGRRAQVCEHTVPDAKIEEWLAKALRGARLCRFVETQSGDVQMRRFSAETTSGSTVGWFARRLEGELLVSDPSELAKTLAFGIGSGRGFGFGLVSVAVAR